MLKKTRSLLPPLALLCFILCGSGSWATAQVPIGGGILDVEYTVGTGSNISYVVVDFDGSTAFNSGPGESYAFGYRWEGEATAADALLALSDATSVTDATGVTDVLEFDFDDFGGTLGLSVNRLAYLEDDEEALFGNPDGRFWGIFDETEEPLLPGEDEFFVESGIGISGLDLSDGSFTGLRVQVIGGALLRPDFPVLAVPEPNSALCWLIATVALSTQRRRRR